MRILFFTHYFPPEVNAPAVRTHQHCRRWVREGHEVHVVTCVPNHPRGEVFEGYRSRLRTQREKLDGIHVHRVWTYVAPNRGFLRRTLGYLSYMFSAPLAARRVPRPDVVVATSPQLFCAWAGLLASRLVRRPWVLELRDLWPASIEAVGAIRNRAVIKSLERLELCLYGAADAVVALTEAFRVDLVRRGVDAAKIEVVTNGIGPDAWNGVSRDQAREALGLPRDRFLVSYVGTHGMAHGLETLLEVADILRDVEELHFLTVGDGAEYGRLQRLRSEKQLDNLTMVGQVPREQARLYLHASDVSAVLLRRSDLFRTVIPSKVFEAMAVGNGVLLTVDGEARAIVEGAGAGVFVEPENPTALAQAVKELMDSPADLRAMGENGRRAVRSRFNRAFLARKMLRVLDAVADRNGRAGVGPRPAAGRETSSES